MRVCFAIFIATFACATAAAQSVESLLAEAFGETDSRNRKQVYHIGLDGLVTDSGFLVTAVLEQSAAFAAGIDRGDVIVAADGKAFHPFASFPSGEPVDLRIQRGNSEREVTVNPRLENLYDAYRSATVASVQEFAAGNKVIGYVRFWALSRNTGDLVTYRRLIKRLEYCDGIVLDLRNVFGFWDQAQSDLFLPLRFGRDNYERPVTVLINQDTPTGAEQLARSMQRLERITTLGETSKSGLEPEIPVPYPYEQTTRNDPQFEAAVNNLLGII